MSIALTDFSFEITFEEILEKLHLPADSEYIDELKFVYDKAINVAKPKALYVRLPVSAVTEDSVCVGHTTFQCSTLSNRLGKHKYVFAYIATCGAELDSFLEKGNNVLQDFALDVIKEHLLFDCKRQLDEYLIKQYELKGIAGMTPGSGTQQLWAIEELKPLFAEIGDVENQIGVVLTDSCLMLPNKTISGIIFDSDKPFISCVFCPRKNCEKRLAAFSGNFADGMH
jgi:hypothetical protein